MSEQLQHTVVLTPEAASADISSYLQTIQKCLCSGDLKGADQAIGAASRQCVSHDEERMLTVLVLRRKLISGRYHEWEDPEGVWQRAKTRWPSDPQIEILEQALFHSAGWAESQRDTPPDGLYDLLSVLDEASLDEPEILYLKLAKICEAAEWDTATWTLFASNPLPKSVFTTLGELVYPPVVEALLAENWYTHFLPETYPRTALVSSLATTEKTFQTVADVLAFWEELGRSHYRAAAQLADRMFTERNYGFWLRALPLIVHFGSVTQVSAIARRLQTALGFISRHRQITPQHPSLQSVRQSLAIILQLWWGAATQLHPAIIPDAATQQLITEASQFPKNEELPFWSSIAGFSPGINHFLLKCVSSPLTVALTNELSLPALIAAHTFAYVLSLAYTPNTARTSKNIKIVIDIWFALPTVFRNEPEYQIALLDYLSIDNHSVKASDVIILADAGLAVSYLLSEHECLNLFIARPTREHLKAISEIQTGGFTNDWLPLLTALLRLYQQYSPDKAMKSALRRLTAVPDLPTPEVPQDPEGLQQITEMLKNSSSDELILAVAPHIALRAGYLGLHESAEELLNLIAAKNPPMAAPLSARLWLKTGQYQYCLPDAWISSSEDWTLAAYCWHQLCTSAEGNSHAQYPQSRLLPIALGEAYRELNSWLLTIRQKLILAPFDEDRLLSPLAVEWAFIKPFLLNYFPDAAIKEKDPPLLTALLYTANHSIAEQKGFLGARVVLVSYANGTSPAEYAAAALAKAATECPNRYDGFLHQCTGMFSPRFSWKLRRALLAAGQNSRVKAIDSESDVALSDAAKEALSYPPNKTNEKDIRLAMLKVSSDDLHYPQIWQLLADFLHSDFFSPCSKAQWDMVFEIREKKRMLDQDEIQDVISVLEDKDKITIEKMFFQTLKPILIDVSNLIYDAAVEPYVKDPFDFIEGVWQTLAAAHFYPILSFIDKPKVKDYAADIMRHLNRLTEQTKIAATTGQIDLEASADYHILIEAGRWLENQVPLIVTNDYFAKSYRSDARKGEANGFRGHPSFPWLNEAIFASMQSRFTQGPSSNTWEIVPPDNNRILIRNPHTQ